MGFRNGFPLLVALALLAVPSVSADGDHGAEETYNPLVLHYEGHFAADTITRDVPAAGAVVFPAGDWVTPPPALAWAFPAPVKFRAAEGFAVDFLVEARAPLVMKDSAQHSFAVGLLVDGIPVEGAETEAGVDEAVLLAGQRVRVTARLDVPDTTFEPSALLAITIRPIIPVVAPDSLAVIIGPDASRLNITSMRVPSVMDLRLDNGALTMFDVANELYRPADTSVAYDVRVLHDAVPFGAVVVPAGTRVDLVFKGEETGAAAHAHTVVDADERNALAHEFFVGAQRVLVHPGVGVVVPVTSDTETVVNILCGNQCPEPGFHTAIRFEVPTALDANGLPVPAHRDDGGLIPPPRDTSGVAVSKDGAPPSSERGVPAPGVVVLIGLALLVALARRHR